MTSFRHQRPAQSEFNPFYAGYVGSVPDGDVVQFLHEQQEALARDLSSLTPDEYNHRYAHDKWSLKEVLGHMTDTEWVFSYRLLRFVREDETPLPGMDQDVFMEGKPFEERSFEDMVTDFVAVRSASLRLIGSITESQFNQTGTASGSSFTVRALVWIIAGHCQHHLNVIHDWYLTS